MKNITKKLGPELSKIASYDKPTPWYYFTRLAQLTQSVNLGQGFPDWDVPPFYLEALQKNITDKNANHQYCRSAGSLKLTESISRNYTSVFNRKINHLTEVLVSGGACSILYCAITALVQPGDEVILLDPCYDCYTPQTIYAGGKVVGVSMIPPKRKNIENYKNIGKDVVNEDIWKIDFEKLEKSLNEKTKVIVINSPNNPTGKIFTYEELNKIAALLKNFPNIVVISDEVYEHMIYENYTELPRMANVEGMWDRTISVMSGGKIFSVTGARVGWGIGPSNLIKQVHAIHQFNMFGLYEPLQNAFAECLDIANNPYKGYDTYYKWLKAHYLYQRNYMLQSLAKLTNYKADCWLPEGGYFIMADISGEKPTAKYFLENDDPDTEYSKDYNYCLNLANEKKVVVIPGSVFYTKENRHLGEDFVRLAYCKKTETIDSAMDALEKN